MKKIIAVLTVMTALLCMFAFAHAAEYEALDLTEKCIVRLGNSKNTSKITDKKFTSYLESKKVKNPTLEIDSSEDLYGLYLCFRTLPENYLVEVDRGSGWETFCQGDTRFYHVYYPLDGVRKVRVYAEGDKKQILAFNEIYVFSDGVTPSWVQRWEPLPDKVDLFFFVAHPEEELLYLGGAIPYYACEKNVPVGIACFSSVNTTRRSEFLNGLWSMGYRYYPVIGEFKSASSKSVKAAYKGIDQKNGEKIVVSWLTEILRHYRPEVIVGPDLDGEGNNGQRMMLADACRKSYALAADENYDSETLSSFGTWQVKKLYLHLYGDKEEQISFDWDQPLSSLGNRTGRSLSYSAYLYHKTQDDTEKTVFGTGEKYRNNLFGLVESTVGQDVDHNDFLEHIDSLSEYRLSEPLETFQIDALLPELNEQGYLDEGEFIYSDDLHGNYIYVDDTLKVIIRRKYDGSLPLTWFESEIWCDVENGERMENIEYDPAKRAKVRVDAAKNALENKIVFACNADYYTYRVGAKNGHPVGIEIRNGEIYYDTNYDEPVDNFFPNLDTLAFYEDGNVDVHRSHELAAKDYLERGAYNVYSFGPSLMKDGEFSAWVLDSTKSRAKNPRHCFGAIEPGHYMDIMCEGRLGTRSEGVTMPQLAMLAQAAGCRDVCNLDGGQTAVVVFMGKQLNKIGKYDGKTNARETCEILGIGVSEQVGTFEVK